MGLWERDRPPQDAPARPDPDMVKRPGGFPDIRARSGFPAEAGRRAEPADATLGLRKPPLSVEIWNPPLEKFTPNWRKLARNLVIGPEARGAAGDAYKALRTEALKRLRQNEWKTVAITSPSGGSGATLTSINLAVSMARDLNQTVLLVELDLIDPSFHRILGFEPRRGVVDYLLHDAPLSQIVLDIGVERLAVIPAGAPVANSSELLSSPRMAQFLAEIGRYSGRLIVLFDLPAALEVDDAMAFAPLADCAMLVVEEGVTPVDDVRRALARLAPTPVLGTVLNRSLQGRARAR